MINWIFDLDHTLYQQEYSRFSYRNLKYSPEINHKLNSLPGKKYYLLMVIYNTHLNVSK